MMNQEQVLSVTRDLLQIVGTFLTTYGLMSSTQWAPVAGGVLMIVPVVWGIINHSQTNAVAVVAAMPEVKKIETEPTAAGAALAKASPVNVVVAAP